MIDTREARVTAAEVKFVVPEEIGGRVQEWSRRFLEPDPHGTGRFGDQYRTTTLYVDTPTRDVFHQRGSTGRAKYRIRRYEELDFVFLERKLRRPRLLVKRRTQVPLSDLCRLAGDSADWWPGAWFEHRLAARNLGPSCQLVYQRMARGIGTAAGVARLTVDRDLGAVPAESIAFSAETPLPVIAGQSIVEMKFRGPLPAIFKRLVEDIGLSPTTVSKYRLGVAALAGLPVHEMLAAAEREIGV
jgi:hypothetical protein